jgi:hypothetical protein
MSNHPKMKLLLSYAVGQSGNGISFAQAFNNSTLLELYDKSIQTAYDTRARGFDIPGTLGVKDLFVEGYAELKTDVLVGGVLSVINRVEAPSAILTGTTPLTLVTGSSAVSALFKGANWFYLKADTKLNIYESGRETTGNLSIVNGNVGLGTTTNLHKFAVMLSSATNLNGFNFTNTDINKIRTTVATATDTSSKYLKFSPLGSPTEALIGKDGAVLIKTDSSGTIIKDPTFTGVLTGSSLTRGTDAFTTTAETDTVTISGASVNDFYTITLTGTAAPSANDAIRLEATATGFILHRAASGTSGLTYVWKREK